MKEQKTIYIERRGAFEELDYLVSLGFRVLTMNQITEGQMWPKVYLLEREIQEENKEDIK